MPEAKEHLHKWFQDSRANKEELEKNPMFCL